MIDHTTVLETAASICGTKVSKVRFQIGYHLVLFARRECRALLILITAIVCYFPGLAIGQQSLLPSSGSGKVFVVMPEQRGIIIIFDDPSIRPNGGRYSYDPKSIVVEDSAGNPIDIFAVRGLHVDFTAGPNRHPSAGAPDNRMEITKLVLQPGQSQRAAPDDISARIAQSQDIIEQQKKKQAEAEAAERAKAAVQEKLRQQMAQKQQESLTAEKEGQKLQIARAKQKQQQLQAKREQFAGTIVRTKAKIEEQEVAPTGSAIKYAVSPHAVHVATATLKGSRPLILMDGIPGPTFDELVWVNRRIVPHSELDPGSDVMNVNDAPVIFSDDGTRYAYVGRQGNQFVLMVDGKEAARGVYVPKHHWTDWGVVDSLSFVPGSNRLRYVLTIPKPKEIEAHGDYYRGTQLVVEGDKNPPVNNLYGTPFSFSRAGRHYAYFADFPDDPNGFQAMPHLVVDGKVNPPDYTVPGFTWVTRIGGNLAPLFTGDSKHLITVRSKRLPSSERKGEFVDGPLTIFVDQKPVLEAPFVEKVFGPRKVLRRFYAELKDLSVAPAGANFIAVFAMPNQDPMSSSTSSSDRIFSNDRRVIDVPKFERVVWSPNGKRYAAQCATDHNSGFMVIDGKKEPEYRSVSLRRHYKYGSSKLYDGFTADSSKSVYVATTDKTFLIVEGEESDGFESIDDLSFSDEGGHIAFVATTDAGEKMPVIDGSALPPRTDVHDFAFLPNGAHYIFLSGARERGAKVVIDGIEQAAEYGGDFVYNHDDVNKPKKQVLISPDGKHSLYLAAIGRVDTGGYSVDHLPTKAVCLDGQLIPCESEHSEVTPFFTPDSKHVVWIDRGGKTRRMANGGIDYHNMGNCSIYVDGQVDADFECSMIERTQDSSEMRGDGTLTLIAQFGNALKKLRVTPSPDTTMARFAAIAQQQQMAAQEESTTSAQPNW
jgi:hypothetical protein